MRLLVLIFFSFLTISFAGNDLKLVVISSSVGDEIDRLERDQFGLFPEIDNFISARFYRKTDGSYRAQVKYFKDGEVRNEQIVISNEEFFADYYSLFNSGRMKIRTAKPKRIRRLLNFHLAGDHLITGYVDSIRTGRVFLDRVLPDDRFMKDVIFVKDIEEFSVVRHTNLLVSLGIGSIPGLVGAGLVFLGSDEDISISSRRSNTESIFILGEIIGLSIGGTIAAFRGIDYDFPVQNKTVEEKQNAILNTQNYKVRLNSKLQAGPWFALYHSPSALDDYALIPGLRVSIAYSPRMKMELVYGYSTSFGKEHQKKIYNGQNDYKVEELQLHLLRLGFRAAYSRRLPVNPFVSWGWGMTNRTYGKDDDDFDLFINIDAGIEHDFSDNISIETRLGLIENFNSGLEYLFQIGVHLGK